MSNTEIKKVCCRLCSWYCPVLVHVGNGEVLKVEGDPLPSRATRGFVCERATLAAIDFHNHPQRLNYPLKRVGARGEGKWAQITWVQAMDEIAEKLEGVRAQYGPEAVACMTGHGSGPHIWAAYRWCNLFGTPNTFQSTKNCWQPQLAVELAVYGSDTFPNFPRPGVTKCMVVFGGNPYEAVPPAWNRFVEAKRQGAKLIVIDPRRTRVADMADLWLQIRPGTDGALAYAMLNVIIEEELYDKQFVQDWCLGFDQVRNFVKEYPPQVVESLTWIPKEKIVEAARMYAQNKPAMMQAMWGVAHSQLGKGRTLCINLAKCILRAITGNLDVEGGETLRGSLDVNYGQNMHWGKLVDHPLRKRDTVGADRFPVMSVRALKLYEEAWRKVYGEAGYALDIAMAPNPSPFFIWSGIMEDDPYPIRALIVSGLNVLCTRTNIQRVHRALTSEKLELQVAVDVFMTPHGMLADYVLPAADWMERPYLDPAFCYNNLGEQAVKPKYERRNEYEFWQGLGIRLDQRQYWPDTPEEIYNEFLDPTGLTFEEFVRKIRWEGDKNLRPSRKFRKYQDVGFATPSGKVELVPTLLKELGYELLPQYDEPASSPECEASYPLILITGGRLRTFFHSTLREQPRLRRRHPDPLVQVHPDTAREHGITHGDWVSIETPQGRIKHKAELTDRIHPQVVHIEHGWWFPEQPGEEPDLFGLWQSNAGAILPDDPDVCDYQGGPPMRALRCRIVKS